jgi:hypothetical protein
MNFLFTISKGHYGSEANVNQYSTLHAQINALSRQNIPASVAPFHYLEELILQSFDS